MCIFYLKEFPPGKLVFFLNILRSPLPQEFGTYSEYVWMCEISHKVFNMPILLPWLRMSHQGVWIQMQHSLLRDLIQHRQWTERISSFHLFLMKFIWNDMDDTTPKKLINMEAKQKSPNLFFWKKDPPISPCWRRLLPWRGTQRLLPKELLVRSDRGVGVIKSPREPKSVMLFEVSLLLPKDEFWTVLAQSEKDNISFFKEHV